jgi:hypothetical protein
MEIGEVVVWISFITFPLVSVILACIYGNQDQEEEKQELRSPVLLPHFPYAQQSGLQDPVTCPICLDKLRHGQLCSEVPACRHTFHEACIRAWAMKTNSCPLCRVKIVPAANDMV